MCILCVLLTVLYFTGNGGTQARREKVHATIPKGIVRGFEFTVLQKKLKNSTSNHGCMFGSAKSPKRKQQK